MNEWTSMFGGDSRAKDGTVDEGSLWESGGLRSYRESFPDLSDDNNHLCHLIKKSLLPGDSESVTWGEAQGGLFLPICSCCGLRQMLHMVLSLRNPPQRISCCLLRHHLHGLYRHLQIPQQWQTHSQATATISGRKPVHYAGLQQGLALLPQLTSPWNSVKLSHAEESFHSYVSPPPLPFPRVHQRPLKEWTTEQIPTGAKPARPAVVRNGSVLWISGGVACSSVQKRWQTKYMNTSCFHCFPSDFKGVLTTANNPQSQHHYLPFQKFLIFLSYRGTDIVASGSKGLL